MKYIINKAYAYSSLVLNRWATSLKSGEPQTFGYCNNGFASRMRLRNAGAYEQPYRPALMSWRRSDVVFLCNSAPILPDLGNRESMIFFFGDHLHCHEF